MATRTPQEILEDNKIKVLIDDLESEIEDAFTTVGKLTNSASLKNAPKGGRNLDIAEMALGKAFDAYEREYSLCVKGKSTDIAKLKSLVSTLLDKLDDLQEMIGRVEVLENAEMNARLLLLMTLLGQVVGYGGEFNKLIRDMESLRSKLQKAIKAVRDVKTKTMVTGAIAAVGICLTPLGATAAVLVAITGFAVGQALDSALDGNVDSDAKKTWDKISKVGDAADTIGKMPKAFGPVLTLISSGVDLRECFTNERDKQAVEKQIKDLKTRIDKLGPPYAKMYQEMSKKGSEVMSKLTKAASDVNSFRPSKPKAHTLPNLLK